MKTLRFSSACTSTARWFIPCETRYNADGPWRSEFNMFWSHGYGESRSVVEPASINLLVRFTRGMDGLLGVAGIMKITMKWIKIPSFPIWSTSKFNHPLQMYFPLSSIHLGGPPFMETSMWDVFWCKVSSFWTWFMEFIGSSQFPRSFPILLLVFLGSWGSP